MRKLIFAVTAMAILGSCSNRAQADSFSVTAPIFQEFSKNLDRRLGMKEIVFMLLKTEHEKIEGVAGMYIFGEWVEPVEGRLLVLATVGDLLDLLNGDVQFSGLLDHFPMKYEDITLTILVPSRSGKIGEIGKIELKKGIISYRLTKGVVFQETFEEALNIVVAEAAGYFKE